MNYGRKHEDPATIKNKRTPTGGRNPRYVTACNEAMRQREFQEDLAGMFKRLSPEEIAAQYPDKKVDELLTKAKRNLKEIIAMKVQPVWMVS